MISVKLNNRKGVYTNLTRINNSLQFLISALE